MVSSQARETSASAHEDRIRMSHSAQQHQNLQQPRLTSNDWKAVEYVSGPIDDIFVDTLGGAFDFSLSYLESDYYESCVDSSSYGPELISEDYVVNDTCKSDIKDEPAPMPSHVDHNLHYRSLEQQKPLRPISSLIPKTQPSSHKNLHNQLTKSLSTSSSASANSKVCKDINSIANQKIKHQCTERDVLFGRGGARNHHAGNRRYRQLVSDNKSQYRKSSCKDEKTKIAKSIVDAVNKYGGRFLMQDAVTGDWIEVEKRKARQKVSQALRD